MSNHLMSRDAATVLHLLDGPFVTIEGHRMEVPEGSKRLLVFVALHAGRIERKSASGALWPVGDDLRAAGNLRSALWRLRSAGVDLLTADKWSLKLRDDVVVDVGLISEWATRLIRDTATVADLSLPPPAANALDLLPGWYDDWILVERERMRQRTLHALEALTRRLIRAGRCPEAVEAALLAVSAEPLRESAQRVLIDAHLAEGNWIEGWRAYESYRALLRRELDAEPPYDLSVAIQSARRRPFIAAAV